MRFRSTFPALILILAVTLAACGPNAGSRASGPNINITGSGTVYVTPDIAHIYVGVHTENPDIGQAVTANNTQAQRVMDALKALGIEAKDIQTSNFSVYSSQQYDKLAGQPSGTTYMVDNTVYITVRDLPTLPNVLDAAIQAGANNINSIQFDIADKNAALQQARQLAADNAKTLAQEMASYAGVQLGSIQNISYTDSQAVPYYSDYGKGGGGNASSLAPINPGQMQLTVTVSITYTISK